MPTAKIITKTTFAHALRSFLGYLEGTHKALHTIDSYRSDLTAFQNFLESGLARKTVGLREIQNRDLERYAEHLLAQGLRVNTRRRRILTVRRFLHYLGRRHKVADGLSHRIAAPFKVERVPATLDIEKLIHHLKALPQAQELELRNQVLLWCLAETGCLVSEVARLRGDGCVGNQIQFEGKNARSVEISSALVLQLEILKKQSVRRDYPWLFLGFNRSGPLGGAITPRGVELLVRHHARVLGYKSLTPRLIRHSAVVSWFKRGMLPQDIQRRLGLKTDYAFRVYRPLFEKR